MLTKITGLLIAVMLLPLLSAAQTSVTTRSAAGRALSWTEMDRNITNLRDAIDTNAATLGGSLATLMQAQAAGTRGYQTKSAMDMDLNPAENTLSIVTNDSDVTNNTYWIKIGASGTGYWQKSNLSSGPRLVNASLYADLTAAVAAQGSTSGLLVVSAPISVSSSLTIPSTCGVWVITGGSINIAAGATLTVSGAFLAQPTTIFTGNGQVQFGSQISEADVAWFGGNFNAAVASLSSGNVVGSGTYTVTAPVILSKINVGLKGKNGLVIQSQYDGPIIQVCNGITSAYRLAISDLRIVGDVTKSNQIGIFFNGVSNSVSVSDIYVRRVVMDQIGGKFITANYAWVVTISESELGISATNPGKLVDLLSSNVNHFSFVDCKLMRSQYAGYAITVRGIRHSFTRCQIEFNQNGSGVVEIGDTTAPAEQVTVSECWIADNTGSEAYIYVGGNSNTTVDIRNCTITKSDSVTQANAINVQRGSPSIANNSFRGTWGTAIISFGSNVVYAMAQHNRALSGSTTNKIVNAAQQYLFNVAFDDSTWGRLMTNGQPYIVSSLKLERAYSEDSTFFVQMVGDTTGRFAALAGGALQWGDGTNARDVSLLRPAANVLALGAGDSLGVGTVTTSSGSLGAVSKKMPIYNESGVLQGYIPIFSSLP